MHRRIAQLKAARRMPLSLVAAKLLLRAGVRSKMVNRWALLADQHNADPDRLARLYLAFVDRACEQAGWSPIDFAGINVLEIGCGKLAGLGPLSVAGGAAYYAGIDPGIESSHLRHPKIIARYLTPALTGAHELLASRIGQDGRSPTEPGMPASPPRPADFHERAGFFPGGLETFPTSPIARTVTENGNRFDAAVSISCLEHIEDLGRSLAALREVLSPNGRQLHLVNFSNHLDKAAPFKHLYDMTPEQHRARYGAHINFLRPPDILAAFRAAGFEATLLPVDIRPDAVPAADLSPWWRDKYTPEDLAIRTALILA